LKNDVNVPSKSNKQKNLDALKVTGVNRRIRSASGSVPKFHGSATLVPMVWAAFKGTVAPDKIGQKWCVWTERLSWVVHRILKLASIFAIPLGEGELELNLKNGGNF
jgi:hypothetical protein